MKTSIIAKRLFAFSLQIAGVVSRRLRRHPKSEIAVLMYHRVLPRNEMDFTAQAGMFVEPETLKAHLLYLRRHFEVVPLSYLALTQPEAEKISDRKPLCALTFDDGWVDFYKYAFPILRANDIPATVFLPTDFIGTERWFWTDRLAFLLDRLLRAGNFSLDSSATTDGLLLELTQTKGSPEEKLESMIARLKAHLPERIDSVLTQLTVALGEGTVPTKRAFLSWEEVREMFASGLITFGSHTASHPLLTNVSEEIARQELSKSKVALIAQGVVDRNCISFSYPNGSYSAALSRMAQEEGYHLAVITQRGWHKIGTNPYTIRRIAIHEDMSTTGAMFGARIVNLI